jgi:hypothetical protein
MINLDGDDFIALEARFMRRVKKVMLQLYREERLDGDKQRDLAQELQLALDNCVSLEGCEIKQCG